MTGFMGRILRAHGHIHASASTASSISLANIGGLPGKMFTRRRQAGEAEVFTTRFEQGVRLARNIIAKAHRIMPHACVEVGIYLA